MEASGTVGGWRPSDVSDICYGSQRRITIVGTAMKHGRHLAGIGLERFGNGKDVRLLAKASPQRSRRVCFSQCQEMCTRRRTASFHSFSDESVDSTSLKRRVQWRFSSQATNQATFPMPFKRDHNICFRA